MFDSHCHLDDESFDADRDEVLAQAAEAGVSDILIPAIRPATFDGLLGVVARGGPVRLHAALGFHPQTVPNLSAAERAAIAQLPRILQDARAVAVGECGLDGPTGCIEDQEQLFRAQIRVARDVRLPLVVHAFRTHEAVLRILRDERAHEVGGVIHSFSGGVALIGRYVDLGFVLSFAGAVTWERAKKPVSAAAAVPDEALLVETDAPDQSPQTRRGQRNAPAAVGEVVASLAHIRGQTVQHMAALTLANAQRLFRLA